MTGYLIYHIPLSQESMASCLNLSLCSLYVWTCERDRRRGDGVIHSKTDGDSQKGHTLLHKNNTSNHINRLGI